MYSVTMETLFSGCFGYKLVNILCNSPITIQTPNLIHVASDSLIMRNMLTNTLIQGRIGTHGT